MSTVWHQYVVRTVHDTHYTGIATDVARREKERILALGRLRVDTNGAIVRRRP